MPYHLSIITPEGKIFDDDIESLSAPGSFGSFGVLSHHAPMVIALEKGVVQVKQSGQEKYFATSRGVLEVDQDHNVLLLSEGAVASENREQALASVRNIAEPKLDVNPVEN